jgi:ABC-type antimicrobial peptide transport system permease subunit
MRFMRRFALTSIGLLASLLISPARAQDTRLGASPREVLALVLRQGVVLATAGAAAGMMGALALARGLGALLFGVGPADPVSYAAAAVVMALAVLLACRLPAWRATRLDPMVALRNDG